MTNSMKKGQVVIFYIASILFFISITAFDPFISTYASELGFKSSLIGTIIGAAGIASLITRFPIGVISDFLHNKKLIIQLGLLITIASWLIAFLNPSATTLYIGKIADGVTGATWVIYNTMFISFFPKDEAPKAVGILAVVSPIGSFIGSFIGGIISNNYGYRYSFLVAVVAAGIALILIGFIREEKLKRDLGKISNKKYDYKMIKEQLTDKYIWVLGIIAIISIMVPYATRDTFTPIIAKNLGGGAIFITVLSNIHMITNGIASSLTGTFFYKKLGLINTTILGAVGQGIVAMLVPFSNTLGVLICLQALAGFSFGLSFTTLMSLSVEGIDEQKQSTRMGLFQSIYSAGMFFGPVLIGLIIEKSSIVNGFFIIGVVSILSALFIKRVNYKQKIKC